MTKDELKQYVYEYLDSNRDELIYNGETLLQLPERSYQEFKFKNFCVRP